jgi:hypothetical protein
MATQTVLRNQPFGNRSAVLCILARRAAIKAVKADFQARGKRLSYISARDIRACADAYLANHQQELFAEAMETVQLGPEIRTLYEVNKPISGKISNARRSANHSEQNTAT